MKQFILLLLISFSVTNVFGQSDKKNMTGAHVAVGDGLYGATARLSGAGGYDINYNYGIGLDYSRALSQHWDLCTGLEYTCNDMTLDPAFDPESESVSYKTLLKMVTIPVQAKYHFGKFYLNGGGFFHILSKIYFPSEPERSPKDSRLGIFGCGLGIGFEHEFSKGIVLSINPYLRWDGVTTDYLLLQGGVRLGLGYKL